MNRRIVACISLMACLNAQAQDWKESQTLDQKQSELHTSQKLLLNDAIHPTKEDWKAVSPFVTPIGGLKMADTLQLPDLANNPPLVHPFSTRQSYRQGLNMELSLSAFAEFGRHAYRSGGFSQSFSALYVKQLNNRLSVAAGGYFTNMWWTNGNSRDAGLAIQANYQLSENWDAFAFVRKSVVQSGYMPMRFQDMHQLGDRIGAGLRYTTDNQIFSFALSVSAVQYPDIVIDERTNRPKR